MKMTKLRRLAEAIETLRSLCPEMQMQTALTLIYTALHDGLSMQELVNLIGVSQAAISRNVATLGQGIRPGVEGYGLLRAEEDPYNRRSKLVFLTDKGKIFCKDIALRLGGVK